MKAKWLFDEHPILIDKKLAAVIGFNEAVVLQQLNYWLHSNSAKKIDGRLWIYNSYENWRKDNFPFWSTRTIRRIFDSCEKKGIVLTGNFNKAGFDKTKWYSIDENKLNNLMDSPCGQNVQTIGTNSPYQSGQNVQANTRDYPETTSENNKHSASQSNAQSVSRLEEEFEEVWTKYPNKKGKKQAFNHYKAWRKSSTKHTNEYLLGQLNKYLVYCQQNNSWYHPMNGSTWFNGRFDDVLITESIANKATKRIYD
ncbi:conserved phage C-terminal domain-containing protein [Limosilactobacillus reuteri]